MEVVRKIVDAKKLMSVIPLPETMRNRRVEVIVLPAEEQKVSENLKKSGNIESLVDSLVGVIRDTGMTLEDYRAEGWESMRILIDTNVILDVLLKRSPFYETAIEVLKLSARDDIQEFVSASAITDIYYIAYKNLRDKAAVRELLKKLLLIVSVAGVSEEEIQKALELEWNDFEDSVQYSVAALNEMDGIITRNVKDYSSAEMQVWEPAQFLEKTKC